MQEADDIKNKLTAILKMIVNTDNFSIHVKHHPYYGFKAEIDSPDENILRLLTGRNGNNVNIIRAFSNLVFRNDLYHVELYVINKSKDQHLYERP